MKSGFDDIIQGVVNLMKGVDTDWGKWALGKSVRIATSLMSFGMDKVTKYLSKIPNSNIRGAFVYGLKKTGEEIEKALNNNNQQPEENKIDKNTEEFMQKAKDDLKNLSKTFNKASRFNEIAEATANHSVFMKIIKNYIKQIMDKKLSLSGKCLKEYNHVLYIDTISESSEIEDYIRDRLDTIIAELNRDFNTISSRVASQLIEAIAEGRLSKDMKENEVIKFLNDIKFNTEVTKY